MTESEIRWMPILEKAVYYNQTSETPLFYTVDNNKLLLNCTNLVCTKCVYSNAEFNCTSNLGPRIADSEEAYQYVLNNHPEYLI